MTALDHPLDWHLNLFWAVTIRNASEGVFGEPLRKAGTVLRPWIVPITVICYLIVAIIAQFRLDVLAHL